MSKSTSKLQKSESKVFGNELNIHYFWKSRVNKEDYGKLRHSSLLIPSFRSISKGLNLGILD